MSSSGVTALNIRYQWGNPSGLKFWTSPWTFLQTFLPRPLPQDFKSLGFPPYVLLSKELFHQFSFHLNNVYFIYSAGCFFNMGRVFLVQPPRMNQFLL